MFKIVRQPAVGGIWFWIGNCYIGTSRYIHLNPRTHFEAGFRQRLEFFGWIAEIKIRAGGNGREFKLKIGGNWFDRLLEDCCYLRLWGARKFISHKRWVWNGRPAINERG